jgi:hypothetical protein
MFVVNAKLEFMKCKGRKDADAVPVARGTMKMIRQSVVVRRRVLAEDDDDDDDEAKKIE